MFDLASSVDGFLRAAAHVEGLEFLADLQEDHVDADDDFYYEDQDGVVTDTSVAQSLYMVMTNARAVAELVRLFELWQDDPRITFARGLNPLKQVFGLLRAIRRWGPEDRVRETGLLEQWEEDVTVAGAQGMRVEIELWYRSTTAERAAAEARVIDVIERTGGAVITRSLRPPIAYHAVLADIPRAEVARVLAEGPDSIQLLTTEAIMMVAPSRPMVFRSSEPTSEERLHFDASRPSAPPRVALLDGLPLANHVALEGRLIIDDPDDRSSRYGTTQRNHGSAMASLIAHGDLSTASPAAKQAIYVRPILQPHEHLRREEVVPPDELLVDLVHRALHRIVEGDGSDEPAAPSVRVINMSIGDPARAFVRRVSPLARLLDWYAHKYNLVIVVSAGNHPSVLPAVTVEDLGNGDAASAAVATSLYERARHRRILSPAEAVNVITVGALHDDGSNVELPDAIVDVVPSGAPASYSPVGFGYRQSVKPDLLLPGGRQVFVAPPPTAAGLVELDAAETAMTGPGLCTAAAGLAGQVDAIAFSAGTSNAAALATRTISHIFDALETLRPGPEDFPLPDPQYHPVLAKTLLVHAAGWHDLRDELRRLLDLSGQTRRRELTRLLGYGPLRDDRVATADRVRVVLIGAGSIRREQRHTFRFPLPSALAATTEWRRLTITLGWHSPTTMTSQKYRMARLSFTPPREEIGVTPIEADHHAILKGTIQHQVLEGRNAVAFADQSSLAIDVDCRSDAGTLSEAVRYGLAASLEISSTVLVDLHEQVRSRLREEYRVRARAQVAAR